jgi:hypothetical protein
LSIGCFHCAPPYPKHGPPCALRCCPFVWCRMPLSTFYSPRCEGFFIQNFFEDVFYPQSTPWCHVNNLKSCFTLHMYNLHESSNLNHEIEHWWLFILETNCWHPLCFYGLINITYLAHVNKLALFYVRTPHDQFKLPTNINNP